MDVITGLRRFPGSYQSTENAIKEIDRLRAELEKTKNLATHDYMNGQAELSAVRAELADSKARTDELERLHNWDVVHIAQREAELAEWKERHPYGEVDLDMAIEAETKDLKLRIDTLESAQIDYEAQCAAKDARIKEEFDKYCRNLTELAQVHKESCDAKDARIAELEDKLSTAVWSRDHERADNEILHKRIAELEAERALHIEAYNAILARAERAEARVSILEKDVMGYLEAIARAERAEAERDAMRDGNRPLPYDRDHLGRLVREAWVRWAYTQPNPKPSWLVNYDELTEPDKEADRQIGECIARWTIIGDAARAALGGMEKIDGRD